MMPLLLLVMMLGCSTADATHPRVRPDDPDVRALIQEGLRRSATFRSLVTVLDNTDVTVFVRSEAIRGGLGGYLPHRVFAHDAGRYVTVIITSNGSRNRRIAVLAHELRHALEIAQFPAVGRSESVQDLYARIGFRRHHARDAYETMDAVQAGDAVQAELVRGERGCAG
jgi:hypothetical protein